MMVSNYSAVMKSDVRKLLLCWPY